MIDLEKLNEIAARVLTNEFTFFLSITRYSGSDDTKICHVTLSKGATYGKFHIRVEAHGATPSEAFEAALRQFPPNPIDGVSQWDSQRLSPPEDGEFTEVKEPRTGAGSLD
jgi:hypothetical protein